MLTVITERRHADVYAGESLSAGRFKVDRQQSSQTACTKIFDGGAGSGKAGNRR
jgi:hypothetical protein